MRIGVNAFPLRTDGGGSRYCFAGIMGALLDLDQKNRYIIFSHFQGLRLVHQIIRDHAETLTQTGPDPRVRVIEVSDEGQIYAFRDEFDLYYGPLNNLNPRIYDRPTVAVLHDIQEQYFPEYFNKSDLLGRYEDYPEIARAATTLVTVSQFCKQSFVDKFGIDERKIDVVYNAPQPSLVERDRSDPGKWTRGDLPAKYVFYPSNCYKHKGHAHLLDAIERLRKSHPDLHVVFTGFELPKGFPLRKEIASRGLDDRCHCFTDLSADELRYIYRHAIAVVLPTMFEGFGIPAVEALACGVPLVCSDLPALREVAEDNALYFEPGNLDQMVRQIERIVSEPQTQKKLIEDGYTLADKFSWHRSAAQMLEIFEKSNHRFSWGYADHKPEHPPRIGVLVRLIHNGGRIVETLKSLIATGYPNLYIRAILCGDEPNPGVREFLQSNDIQLHHLPAGAVSSFEQLETFAKEEGLDIVGEILEGNRFKATAMHSLAWGYFMEPNKPLYLGESFDWNHDRFTGVARLRLTGDALWKLEGFLYPEIMFVNTAAFANWSEGRDFALASGPEWHWELLREARPQNKVFVLRRTLADCDQVSISAAARRHAATRGINRYYRVADEKPAKVRLLRHLEPLAKSFCRLLPMPWQHAGTRLWYRMAR